jgi:hypothetical protein
MDLRWTSLRGLLIFGLLLAGSGASQAQTEPEEPRLTLRVLASNHTALTGDTSDSGALPNKDTFFLNVYEKDQWYAVDLEMRLGHGLSLDFTSSQGDLQEVLTTISPVTHERPPQFRTSTVRHNMLSLLYHPVHGRHLFDFYFGPSLGQVHFSRAFAASENELAQGGKIGFDVHLGASRLLFSAEGSILSSDFQVADGGKTRKVLYTQIGAGLGYGF